MDAEGFNLPIRLHVKKDKFLSMLQLNNGNSLIREYKGASDFERIPANLLLPITREYWQKILELEKSAKTQREKNIYSHLRYIMKHKKYPAHFGKKNDITYVDANTGRTVGSVQDLDDNGYKE